ncbi:putative Embryo sac development arrest 6 [Cinnamomum micranthum f. kanehirae]|uniref:Putative Embryo sac development arrest 6 n=1 Tax=Cinnamomum micranthum f. kanehirae TaxID=337451 RepID=A0A3S3R9Q5_9MAGN|nr:putative Embryo sac development arrest 6 [Cinnamomum micranthum f. kanehirae]
MEMCNGSRQAQALAAPRKRKERDGIDASPLKASASAARAEPAPNWLLAGYLAHEFLTRGTLFGEKWDPPRAEAVPAPSEPKVKRRKLPNAIPADENLAPNKPKAYADVANLLNDGGAHIPGIVNPTQLVQWLQDM